MTSSICERLRRYRPFDEYGISNVVNPDGPEAADLIETQAALLEEVEGVLGNTHKLISEFAVSGFTDPAIGERLFANQGLLNATLAKLKERR